MRPHALCGRSARLRYFHSPLMRLKPAWVWPMTVALNLLFPVIPVYLPVPPSNLSSPSQVGNVPTQVHKDNALSPSASVVMQLPLALDCKRVALPHRIF